MNELNIEWNEAPEGEPYHDNKAEWLRWKGTANGEDVTALLHDEVVEDKCDQAVVVELGSGAMTTEPLKVQDAAACLEIAGKKMREHYAKTGKVPRTVRVVPSDFGPRRVGNF